MILGVIDPLVLSPMVDVTDAAFRSVCRDQGADITCSEMVSAAGIVHGNAKSRRLLHRWPGEAPYGIQLMSGDATEMARAVAWVAEHEAPDFIDLNLGCPSPNILRSCAGGFLLRDPAQAGRVIGAAVDAAGNIPVSVKMRKGHDEDHETFIEVGQAAQAAGAAWCTLHGRTVVQGYSGTADWPAIARLVEALDIPVIGNGDLHTPEAVTEMQAQTACAGFFIARAAMHDPTIFGRMRQHLEGGACDPSPPLADRLGVMQTYLSRAATLGEVPLPVLKRQVTRFVQGAPGARTLRAAIHAAPDPDAVMRLLEVADLDDRERPEQEHGHERDA